MKTITLAYVCVSLFLVSCNSDSKPAVVSDAGTVTPKMSAAAQKNLDIMHLVDNTFKSGDVSGIDSIIAADFVDHTDKGPMNRDSLKSMIKMMAADKTMKMETTKELADDDYAFAMTHVTGTSDGKDMPAGPYDMHSVEVVRFSNGKAVEHWAYMEMSEAMKMMMSMPGMDKMKAPGKRNRNVLIIKNGY